jgi:ABC-type uncharacterized transport system permease subunit
MLSNASFWLNWAAASFRLASPIALTAAGGVYSERSGIFNIGLEGMMLIGAFFSILGSLESGSALIGALAALGAGSAFGALLAYLTISRRADQIISGIALNFLALGLTTFLHRALLGENARRRVAGFPQVELPGLADIPVVGPVVFEQNLSVYLAYLIAALATWVLFRTTWGLNVRAVGDYPDAAESAGLSVEPIRYWAVIFSGAMAALGGAALALSGTRFFTPGMTAGRGFIALAAIVFGRWNPLGAAAAALLFGAADALQLNAQALGLDIPRPFLLMLPYVLTLVVLMGLMGRARPPQNLGVSRVHAN